MIDERCLFVDLDIVVIAPDWKDIKVCCGLFNDFILHDKVLEIGNNCSHVHLVFIELIDHHQARVFFSEPVIVFAGHDHIVHTVKDIDHFGRYPLLHFKYAVAVIDLIVVFQVRGIDLVRHSADSLRQRIPPVA